MCRRTIKLRRQTMIHRNLGALRHIKLAAVALCLFSGISSFAQAYTMSSKAKGNCPDGYYRAVLDPADSDGKVTEYLLPANVCVRQLSYVYNAKRNFEVRDFIAIEKGQLKPFKGVQFRNDEYEAVVGHYASPRIYFGSIYDRSPYFKDFTGAHPFLVRKNAHAAIRYKKGQYLIDKQTTIDTVPHGVGLCPTDYARVGNSYACYSKKNALKLNSKNDLELVEQKSTKCPSGFSIGKAGGICTSTKAWNNPDKYELSKTPNSCEDGTYRDYGQCLPRLTAVYCEMDLAREKSTLLRSYHSYKEKGTYAMIWRTEELNLVQFKLDLSDYIDVYAKKIRGSKLQKYLDLYEDDQALFNISPLDKGYVPVLHLYSGRLCENIWDSGWSVDPVPLMW